ncbi:Bacteriocin-like peptide N BlpN [Streptococcus sp. DD10]|uniref:Blp family class II bacteriocin n=1 Tax=Streptococcus sp. DD10 TaxID=1777878 RepID=UPI00079223AA|nr:Blp family class II bacteriocin [Streptococcus sp. DD10]KXT74291.1 Bacteriocin-like peptide N BlpN [Streptococcus sp. DD10]
MTFEHFETLNENNLRDIYGGNNAGAAVVAAMSCAAGGIKLGGKFGPWGAAIGGVGGAAICGYLAYTAIG